MSEMPLGDVAPAFVDMAHRIVWATVATVGPDARPRTRILHPIWEWDEEQLTGWVGTGPTPLKRRHLEANPYASVNYWDPSHDYATADCDAELLVDDETRRYVWDLLSGAPEPLGYDPTIIPAWTGPTVEAFAVLRLRPYRLRVLPGSMLRGEGGSLLSWSRPQAAASSGPRGDA